MKQSYRIISERQRRQESKCKEGQDTAAPFEHLSTRKVQRNVYGEISDYPDGYRRLLSAGM